MNHIQACIDQFEKEAAQLHSAADALRQLLPKEVNKIAEASVTVPPPAAPILEKHRSHRGLRASILRAIYTGPMEFHPLLAEIRTVVNGKFDDLTEDQFVESLRDLINTNCIDSNNGQYRLTAKGLLDAKAFACSSKLTIPRRKK